MLLPEGLYPIWDQSEHIDVLKTFFYVNTFKISNLVYMHYSRRIKFEDKREATYK